MKTCKRCESELPFTDFHSDRSRPDGKYPYCKACATAYKRNDHAKHRDERVAKSREYWDENRENLNAERRNRWANDTEYREKSQAANRRSYQKNPDRMKTYVAKWMKDNPDKAREYARRARANNPDSGRDSVSAARARRFGVTVERVKRAVVFERDGGICHICKLPVDPNQWDLDHIVPLLQGGPHSYDNVAVSHRKCNRGRASHS